MMKTLSLDGDWCFKNKSESVWHPATVPGCVHTDLLALKLIPDPFEGINELELIELARVDWVYRREFEIDADFLCGKSKWLICDSVDTISRILINDKPVGFTENVFRRYHFRLDHLLKVGENSICVEFTSPLKYGEKLADAYPHECPGSEYHWPLGQDMDATYRNFVRKRQCQFGWDWAPFLPTCGICDSIRIVSSDTPFIQYLTSTQHFEGRNVRLDLGLFLFSNFSAAFDVEVILWDGDNEMVRRRYHNLSQSEEDASRLELTLPVKRPELWWPNGYGDQKLYKLELRLVVGKEIVDKSVVNVGFRKLELIRKPDEKGESFFFKINGVPIFAKGANWVPPDPFPSRVNRKTYVRLLKMAQEANMNMLRVWGGGGYESDMFYDLCDEYGILVWQDFMFACCSYPADSAFLENVREEARHQIRRLSRHTCLALWCGDNENAHVDQVWGRNEEHSKLLKADYVALGKILADIVDEEDETRTFWASSPWPDEKTNEGVSGDSHIWNLDANRQAFTSYQHKSTRFVSEFGFQSFPNLATLEKWIPKTALTPCSREMDHHQRKKGWTGVILDHLVRNFPLPNDMEWICRLSQFCQGLALKAVVEGWRKRKPFTMGALYWQLNDTWPAVSWASVDCELTPKASHYFVKRFFAPLLPSFQHGEKNLELWLLNDQRGTTNGTAILEVWTTSGELIYEEKIGYQLRSLKNRCLRKLSKRWLLGYGVPEEELVLRCCLEEENMDNCFFLVPYKHLKLKRPRLTLLQSEENVEFSTDVPALFVFVKPEGVDCSNNFFHLFPNMKKTIRITPNAKKLKASSLYDCPGASWG